MGSKKHKEQKPAAVKRLYFDYSLLAVVIILISFGLVMLYSASSYEALEFGDDMYFLKRQALYSLLAVLFALVISFIDYHLYIKLAPLAFIVSIGLMALVRYSPLGHTSHGARRWIDLGFISFQPSEIMKISLIIFLVYMISKMGRDSVRVSGIAKLILVTLVAAAATYYLTDNLSAALIIAGIGFIVIFVSSPRYIPYIIIVAAGIAAIIIGVSWIKNNLIGTEGSFRLTRVLVWLDPEAYADEGGWQVLQGLYAVGSGGFFGKGLGNSTQKLDIIPEAQNDLIFSIICEELGLFGALITLVLFGYLLYRLFFIAQNAPDRHGTLIAAGIFGHIAIQVILNICVVLNIIPTTGISLPFISYGGTSVFFIMIEIGIALGISGRIQPSSY